MKTTTLLILSADTADAEIVARANAAAQTDTHLRCLLIGPSPIVPTFIYSVPPYGIPSVPHDWPEIVGEARAAQESRAAEISQLITTNSASNDVLPVLCATGDIQHIVARHAQAADRAVITHDLRDSPDIFREAALGIMLGSPIGLTLNAPDGHTINRIFIAWDMSQAASRALHLSLPDLLAAKEVVIGCFDPVMTGDKASIDPGTDIAGWLSHHGCNVTLSQYPSGGVEIGQCIQNRATELGADLVVAGAYGHSRMREAVFGGTTRTLLAQSKMPVFMAH